MIKIALGTAAVLGLSKAKLNTVPTTAHFMTCGKCVFDCEFCAQARSSNSSLEKLSRVTWPLFSWEKVLPELKKHAKAFKRICLQTTSNSKTWQEIEVFIKKITSVVSLPISVSYRPKNFNEVEQLINLGFQNIGIALDVVNKKDFEKIKKINYEKHLGIIKQAALKFPGHISTHLIIGFNETEKEVVELLLKLRDWGVIAAFFAFTQVTGSIMQFHKPPELSKYRRLQIAHWLIKNKKEKKFKYNNRNQITGFGYAIREICHGLSLQKLLSDSDVFQTSGCLDCNRPYYNEQPGRIMYNYPRPLTCEEFEKEFKQI